MMTAQLNTGGALCSTPQSLADAQYLHNIINLSALNYRLHGQGEPIVCRGKKRLDMLQGVCTA